MQIHRRSLKLEFYRKKVDETGHQTYELYSIINGKNLTTQQVNIDATVTINSDLSKFATVDILDLSLEHYEQINLMHKIKIYAGWIDDSNPFVAHVEDNCIFDGEILNTEFDEKHTSIIAAVNKNVKKTAKELAEDAKKEAEKNQKASETATKNDSIISISNEELEHLRQLCHQQNMGKTVSDDETSKKPKPKQEEEKKHSSFNVTSETNYQQRFKQATIGHAKNINQQLLQTKVFPDLEKPEFIVTYSSLIKILHNPKNNLPFYITKDPYAYTVHSYNFNDVIHIDNEYGLINNPVITENKMTFTTLLQPNLNLHRVISIDKLHDLTTKSKLNFATDDWQKASQAGGELKKIELDVDINKELYKTNYVVNKVVHACSNYKEGLPHITTIEAFEIDTFN